MFSEDDIIEIHNFLPPDKRLGSGELSGGLPLLTRTISGKGFVTDTSLRREFVRIVEGATSRISIKNASSTLDVDVDVVLQLVRTNPSLAVLSRSQHSIVPKQERSAIIKDLSESLAKGVIINNDFNQSHDIDQDSLQSLLRVSGIDESLSHNTKDYLLSRAYSALLSDTIGGKLVEGVHGLETVELSPQALPGAPPKWLIREHIDHLKGFTVDQDNVVAKFRIEDKADAVHCTPRELNAKKRDKLIDDLQAGELLYLNQEELWKDFQELYPRLEDVNGHLSNLPAIRLTSNFAVSNKSLSDVAVKGLSEYYDQGYIDIVTILPPEVPPEVQSAAQAYLEHRIHEESNDDNIPVRRGHYLLTPRKYDDQLQAFTDLAADQAKHQWSLLKDTPEKDLKIQVSEVISSVREDCHLLRYLAQQGEFEATASNRFTTMISDLEVQNEREFNRFWSEKVSLRLRNYVEGLKVISDAKLLEQLSELLSGYLQKDLIPDIVFRARTQGLVRSRRTRKNVNRFETTLKTGHTDLSSIASIVEKFDRKQGLEEVDTKAIEESKETLIQDMVRRMQKPKTDAPLMFLSFILVLFSKHNPGVVYATGKFAPKLLKLLKVQLSSEEFEQAEQWKEQAKAGKLAQKDREMMIRMAGGAFEAFEESERHEGNDIA